MHADTLVRRAETGVVGQHPAVRAAVLPAGLQAVSTEPGHQVGVSQVAALVLLKAGGELSQD